MSDELDALKRELDLYRRLLDLSAVDDVQALLQQAVEVATDAAEASQGYLAVYQGDPLDPASRKFAVAHGASEARVREIEQTISHGIIAEALARGELVRTASATGDARFASRKSVRGLSIQAVLAAPLGTPPCGVFYVQRKEPRPFSDTETDLLTRISRHIGALARKQLQATVDASEDPTAPYRKSGHFHTIAGRSEALAEVLRTATRFAALDGTMLITGPTGTGKTVLAREVHRLSSRREGPYVELNCAAIPDSLFESELFGAADGAFTDRRGQVVGHVESAEGGTLVLDEVGDIPLIQQAKLLQLLQDRIYRRLGDPKARTANVRVVACTHRDLAALVQEGKFRADLFYRLEVLPVVVPGLHERREDLPAIVENLGVRLADKLGVPWPGITNDAMLLLQQRNWEGHIRELSNVLERAIAMADGPLDDTIFGRGPSAHARDGVPTLEHAVAAFKQRYAQQASDAAGGNKVEAARRLGVSRSTFYKLLEGGQS